MNPIVEHSVHLVCLVHITKEYAPKVRELARQARGRYLRNANVQLEEA